MIEKLDNDNYNLLFSIRRSVRYHIHRRRFYEAWNRITILVALIGGSSSVVTTIGSYGPEYMRLLLPIVVSIVAAFDLAVGSTTKLAGNHGELAQRFIELEKVYSKGKNLTESEFEDAVNQRLRIEASEPTPLRLLDAMCHYEILKSYGDKKDHPKIPWYRRIMVHLLSQTTYARSLPA